MEACNLSCDSASSLLALVLHPGVQPGLPINRQAGQQCGGEKASGQQCSNAVEKLAPGRRGGGTSPAMHIELACRLALQDFRQQGNAVPERCVHLA